MSTRKTHQLGNKYIKAEDIQKYLYDSSEDERSNDNSPKKNKDLKKDNEGIEIVSKKDILTSIDEFLNSAESETKQKESSIFHAKLKESYKLNEKLEKLAGDSVRKCGNSSSNIETVLERKSIFTFSELKNRDACAITSGEFEERHRVEIPKHYKKLIRNTNESRALNFSEDILDRDNSDFCHSNRKRHSPSKAENIGFAKRFKGDFHKKMSETVSDKRNDVEVELESKVCTVPFIRRSIHEITEELDLISEKWKKGYSNYKFPIQWSTPIIKNCCEKWDAHYIPPKAINRYQKCSEGNQSFNSKSSNSSSIWMDCSADFKSTEMKDNAAEMAREALDMDSPDFMGCDDSGSNNQFENLNSESYDKMILRGENQNRGHINENVSNEDVKDRTGKNKKRASIKSNKDKKCNSKKINAKLQSPNRLQNDEILDSNKNYNKELHLDDSCIPDMSQFSGNMIQYDDRSGTGMRVNEIIEESVGCPICSKEFKKSIIEDHAAYCGLND